MKAFSAALLTALVLFTTLAPAQQLNPPADPCCDCFSVSMLGIKNEEKTPLTPDASIPFDSDGTASVYVQVERSGATGCADPTLTISARPVGNTKPEHVKTPNSGSTSSEKVFKFTEADKNLSEKWEIVYSCGKDECTSPFPINLGGECLACQVCPGGDGDGDGTNGGLSCRGDGSCVLPLPNTKGDVKSSIIYNPGGLDITSLIITNPGIPGLIPVLPESFEVTRDSSGKLTSINTGNALIEIAPASPALRQIDPNAFVVTYSNLGTSEPPFRTTTISLIPVNGVNRLRYDTTFAGATIRYEQYKTSPDTRIVEVGRMNGEASAALRQITYARTAPAPGKFVYRITTKERPTVTTAWDSPALIISDTETTWEKQIAGWVQTKEVIDPDGAALTSTWTYYQPGETTGTTTTPPEIQNSEGETSGSIPLATTNSSSVGRGRLKQVSRYDGYQAFYTYALNTTTITQPYAGNPSGKVTTITWNPGSQTETTTTKVNGIITSEESVTHSPTTLVYPRKVSSSGATLSKSSILKPSGSDFGGKRESIRHEDGTLTTYSYTRNAGDDSGYTTISDHGSTTNGTSVAKGTRTTTTVNSRGTTILRKTEAIGYGTDGAIFDSMAVIQLDNVGRPVITAYHPESIVITGETVLAANPAWITTTEYSCCGIASQTDKYGIKTLYSYDGLQRVIKSNRLGVTTEIERLGVMDEDQRPLIVVETKRYAQALTPTALNIPTIENAGSSLVSRSVRNISGTLQQSWSSNPTSTANGALVKSSSTETTYLNAPGSVDIPITLGSGIGSRSVTTAADGSYQTTDFFFDGRTAATYGSLSPAMQYAYTVNSIGEVTSQSYLDGTNLRETTTTQTDWDGRTLRMDYMDGAFATMEYNSKGQMEKSTDPDGVVTLMRYNAEGEQTINAIDLNRNGEVDYGFDTVQFSETVPALDYSPENAQSFEFIPPIDATGKPVWKSISKVWQPGESNPTVVSTSIQAPNGLKSASQSIGVANLSKSETVLNGNGSWTTTSTAPDGTKNIQEYTAGRLTSVSNVNTADQVIESQTQGYDTLNRPITSTHSRTGTSTTNYLSNTADVVASVSDPGNRVTAFTYDIRGRQISVDAPNTVDADNQPLLNITTTTYNPDNTVAETNGDQTYRVSHTYDYADRMISMKTYGTETATTTWQYSPTRGFLLAKRDAADKGATYTYTAAGRLASRTWARGVSTTYSYDNGGRMVLVNYSDSTPDVAIAYDALGRKTSESSLVSSVSQSSVSYSYNPSNLQIDAETITYNLDGQPGADFTRVIDRSQDNLGRNIGWTLGAPTPSSAIDNQVEYQYSATDGRLETVRRGDIPVPQEFDYTYTAQSNLIATITSPAHTVSNVYEPDRNILRSKVNMELDTTPVSSYFYTVNDYGQRIRVTTGGSAFTGSPSWGWGYNDKGEIVKADSSEAGLDRAYAYDGIGNRLKSADSLALPSTNNYTPNALNQYSSILNPQSAILNPSYDDDGNMTSGPLPANVNANSTLIWDGENRLIEAQVAGTSVPLVRYVYDAQSRRIAETVGSNTTVYVYDGWNPIAEYNTTFALTKTYIWGLDLSGSMQGAGGVGGLLSVTDGTGTYYPTFDGNGNVSEYSDSNGNTVAHYEYDPFGKTVVATESKAQDFAHRFSTKPLDLTTGLYYYGYRFYDPETGRWPSRDPIGERGGINLYGFGSNRPVKGYDYLGRDWVDDKLKDYDDKIRALDDKLRDIRIEELKEEIADLKNKLAKAQGEEIYRISQSNGFSPIYDEDNCCYTFKVIKSYLTREEADQLSLEASHINNFKSTIFGSFVTVYGGGPYVGALAGIATDAVLAQGQWNYDKGDVIVGSFKFCKGAERAEVTTVGYRENEVPAVIKQILAVRDSKYVYIGGITEAVDYILNCECKKSVGEMEFE